MIYMPNVYDQADNGQWMYFDLGSRLLQDRIIQVNGKIDEEMAAVIRAQLLYLEYKGTEPITLYIDSPGGSVTAGLSIIDTMNMIESPIATIAIGHACSMGAVILACGTPGMRSATEHTEIMIHQLSSGSAGKMEDMRIAYKQHERIDDMLAELLADACGADKEYLKTFWREDRYMNPEEAKAFGLIDKIQKPAIKKVPC